MDIKSLSRVLLAKVEQAKLQYQQLVVLVGPPSLDKTDLLATVCDQTNGRLVEVSQELSRSLIGVPNLKRSAEVVKLIQQQTRPAQTEVIYLNNIELLFEPSLQVRPLDLFKNISRSQTLIVAFGGRLKGDQLIYAEPGHPEYQFYPARDFLIMEMPQ